MAVVAAEGGEHLAQPVGVREAAQMVDARQVRAGDVEAARLRAGGQQQLVVPYGGAVAEMQAPGVPVDGGDGLAEMQLHLGLRVPGGLVHEDAVPLLGTGQIALGQRRAFIGMVALVTDEDHPAGEPFRTQGFRRLGPGESTADDDKCPVCVDHLMPPLRAAAICERPARSVMAKEGALHGHVTAVIRLLSCNR